MMARLAAIAAFSAVVFQSCFAVRVGEDGAAAPSEVGFGHRHRHVGDPDATKETTTAAATTETTTAAPTTTEEETTGTTKIDPAEQKKRNDIFGAELEALKPNKTAAEITAEEKEAASIQVKLKGMLDEKTKKKLEDDKKLASSAGSRKEAFGAADAKLAVAAEANDKNKQQAMDKASSLYKTQKEAANADDARDSLVIEKETSDKIQKALNDEDAKGKALFNEFKASLSKFKEEEKAQSEMNNAAQDAIAKREGAITDAAEQQRQKVQADILADRGKKLDEVERIRNEMKLKVSAIDQSNAKDLDELLGK